MPRPILLLACAAALAPIALVAVTVRVEPPRPTPSHSGTAPAEEWPTLHLPVRRDTGLQRRPTPGSTPGLASGDPDGLPELPPGRLTFGWVLDPDGRPVEGARVTPWRSDGLARRLDPAATAWTDATGRFEVYEDRLGTSALVVEHPLYLRHEGLPEDSPATIRLQARSPVRLVAIDAHGRPVPAARLRLRDERPGAPWQEHLTDEQGLVVLPAPPGRTFTVAVEAEQGFLAPTRIEAPNVEPVELALTATRSVTVRVVDASGTPLPGARVVWLETGGTTALGEVRAGPLGEARLRLPVRRAVQLLAEHPAGSFELLDVGPGEREVELRSEPSGRLAITTTRGPLTVELVDPSEPAREARRLVLHADRPCEFPLRAGRWIASWSEGSGPIPTTRTVAVRAGERTTLAIDVPDAASLEIALAGPRDGVIAIELSAEGTGSRRVVPLSAGGTTRLDALPPGPHVLSLLAEGGGRWIEPGTLVLLPGEHRRLELAPVLAGRTLQVRSSTGLPLANARARLADPLGLPDGGTSLSAGHLTQRPSTAPFAGADDQGWVQLALAPEGPTRVRVEAPGYRSTVVTLGDDDTLVDLQRGDS
jgi:hypothetical protein